jgi:flagellar hook protein FlgE
MLESIFIGMTGLNGYSRGLRVIANNTANLNTPGFKGSQLQFSDLFSSDGQPGSQNGLTGYGLNTQPPTLNLKQGELRQTGNELDLAIDGAGMFAMRDPTGALRYTRAGQFQFDETGTLVNRTDNAKVLSIDSSGRMAEISIAGLRSTPPKATSTVTLAGNLSSTATDQTVSAATVIDSQGGSHSLSLKFARESTAPAGTWAVTVLDGATTVGTGSVKFIDGKPDPAASKFTVIYRQTGFADQPVVFDLSKDVTSYASGTTSTLAVSGQNGRAAGALTKAGFDDTGTLQLTYSTGDVAKGQRLVLGRFDSPTAIQSAGDNQFKAADGVNWHLGPAGEGGLGTIRAGMIEISNVDLSQEFSDLVIMQRGYQASSQVISTANDMLQELFAMKNK